MPFEIGGSRVRCGLVRNPYADPFSCATVRQMGLNFCLNGFRLPLTRDEPADDPDLSHYSSNESEKTALKVELTTTDSNARPLPVPACVRKNFV